MNFAKFEGPADDHAQALDAGHPAVHCDTAYTLIGNGRTGLYYRDKLGCFWSWTPWAVRAAWNWTIPGLFALLTACATSHVQPSDAGTRADACQRIVTCLSGSPPLGDCTVVEACP